MPKISHLPIGSAATGTETVVADQGVSSATLTVAQIYGYRTLTGPAAGLTITNGNGAAGNPTIALANDLAAIEALSSTGIVRRTGTDAYAVGQASSSLVDFLQAGTGAATRTAQDKMRDRVSVKDFGATGDGGTDDTAAIQSAVTSIASDGGSVFFPAGVYVISSAIDLGTKSRITLFGEASKSIIYLATNSNSDMFTSGDNNTYIDDVVFDGLWLDGNRANQSGGTGSCLYFKGCEFPTVRNCRVTNGKLYNIRFHSTGAQYNAFPRVLNSIVDGAAVHNIFMGDTAYGCQIVGNIIRAAGIVTAGSAGVYCDNNAEILIASNFFDENSIHIRCFSVDRAVISGNSMLSSQQHGVVLEFDCTTCSVVGNVIDNSGLQTSNTFSGIITGGVDSTITGNTIGTVTALMASGIGETGSANRNTISANNITGASVNVSAIGASTVVDGGLVQGTFAPALSFGGGSTGLTYSFSAGNYQKVGNQVTWWVDLQLTAKGSSTGAAVIAGLPYTSSITGVGCSVYFTLASLVDGLIPLVNVSNTIALYVGNAATAAQATEANFTNTSRMILSGSYII